MPYTNNSIIGEGIVEISTDILTWGVSAMVSGGVAFGVIKTRVQNTMTYEKHREICAKERSDTNHEISKLYDAMRETHGLIKEIHGYMKAKNGGQL